ncbi:MAG: aminotransferase class III-fold pyridoxal phosphate-dependent enzyme, partial [Proteobacteria bacterium]|nr:aminotransferase class III-fold pyridoxal phosphate-dependent enzyme [Pseudomonadota bacterium]
AVKALSHTFPYGDPDALEGLLSAHPGEFACIIMEAMTAVAPPEGYLQAVQDLARKHGALFILDEIITGFRFAEGGAQELFGVVPDLATFGKSMGNGYPISALVGRADIMREMEDVFYSFTAGGEAVSIAAALATIAKIQRDGVVDHLRQAGAKIIDDVGNQVRENDLGEVFSVGGNPCWPLISSRDGPTTTGWQVKTLFMQEMLARGILIQGGHNLCFAHGTPEISALLAAYKEVLPILADAVHNDAMKQHLKCASMAPVFQVR